MNENNMETMVAEMKILLDKIALVLLGDPADERNPGVIIRLDRLERSDWVKNRVMFLLGAGTITALIQYLF